MKWLSVLLFAVSMPVGANEHPLERVDLDMSLPSIERGAGELMVQCHSCHSLKYIRYRDLQNLGIAKAKVDEWRSGQMLDDALSSPMSEADAMQSFGKVPPDLSLMAKAREGGPSYVYSYLIGYFIGADGMPGNHMYPETKMPDILGMSTAANDAEKAEIRGKARDIVSFLTWASDPHEAERKRFGYYAIGYLVLLTGLLYLLKVKIWKRLKP